MEWLKSVSKSLREPYSWTFKWLLKKTVRSIYQFSGWSVKMSLCRRYLLLEVLCNFPFPFIHCLFFSRFSGETSCIRLKAHIQPTFVIIPLDIMREFFRSARAPYNESWLYISSRRKEKLNVQAKHQCTVVVVLGANLISRCGVLRLSSAF